MINYNQNQRYFQYKKFTNYSSLIKIDIASILIICVSYLQIITNSKTFGDGTPLNTLPTIFLTIGFTILVFSNLVYLYSIFKQKEIHADLNQGLIFIYKKKIFSEKKLIKQKPLSEFYSAEIKIMTKSSRNLILLLNKTSNLAFIIGQFSLNNKENFNPDPFLKDLEFFFSNNNTNDFTESVNSMYLNIENY